MGWVWGGVRRDRWDWVKALLHSTAALLTYWLATTYCLPASLVSGGYQTESEKVAVAVRIRPFKAEEQGQPPAFVVESDAKAVLELNPDTGAVDQMWNFDHVFDQNASTDELFEETGVSVVERAMEGYNGTVFAYGTNPRAWCIRVRHASSATRSVHHTSNINSPRMTPPGLVYTFRPNIVRKDPHPHGYRRSAGRDSLLNPCSVRRDSERRLAIELFGARFVHRDLQRGNQGPSVGGPVACKDVDSEDCRGPQNRAVRQK